jgi:hypothetical protein
MKVKIIFKIGSVRKPGSDRDHNTDQFGRGSDFSDPTVHKRL